MTQAIFKQEPVDSVVWSIECTVDELQLDLCRVKEEILIDRGFYVDGKRSIKKLTVKKYLQTSPRTDGVDTKDKNIPEFVINSSDLSPKVIEELEVRVDNPEAFGYILREAAGRIFENLDFKRYHQSVARSLKVRLES